MKEDLQGRQPHLKMTYVVTWFTPVELKKFNVENGIKPELMKPYIAGNTKKNMAPILNLTFNNNSALEG